ncbi:MAG: hypothetical protein JO033_27275 [Acidobacteriaceae bacterium]|nr:hypothetical protein [Acidobacteriaceae bacterium]MBV9497903.1 hypothetical protein [Acidobacteriaceae bacterium]
MGRYTTARTGELGDTFGMIVAKMRANPANRVTQEVEILDGKSTRVLPRELPLAGPQHLFSSYIGLVSRSPERRLRGQLQIATGPNNETLN